VRDRSAMVARARETVSARLDVASIAAARVRRYEEVRASGLRSRQHSVVHEALRPGAATDGLEFLDRLPLRKLVRYVGRRAMRKVH
jgi:hypothetical protein